jgi:outer membrane biosynthesis protein TonB
MSEALRCPHCKAALPEEATFCANCGRRIAGWRVPKDTTPATGEAALPGGEEATRQMVPTPSLLRAAAISIKRGGRQRGPRARSKLPLLLAMVLVAVAGGVGGFFVVRAKMKLRARSRPAPAPLAETPPPSPEPPVAAPVPTPNSPPRTPNPPAPSPIVRKTKAGKKAHVIAATTVPVKAPKPVASGGIPHKTVQTDSKSLQMPTVQHETTTESAPQSDADQKQEAEARLDADSVRFVVRQHLPQVRACYARAFKEASPGGAVEIGFAIDTAGRAKNVRTETNTTDSESLAHCLEERVRQWQFPRPVGGDYELIYPFVFAPGS